MKLLSVAIPMFNAEQYLDECLQSVVSQGFSADELDIILINDDSQDSSVILAKKWMSRHPNIRLVHHERSRGISAVRNIALDLAQTKFFAFLDADDIVADGMYRRMIDQLEASGSDFITGPVYRFSEHQRKAWAFTRNIDLFRIEREAATFAEHPEFVRDFMVWNKIFRREFIVGSGVQFPEGMIYEDVAVMPYLYEKARAFDVVTEPPVLWRMSPGSISHAIRPEKALDRLEVLQRLKAHFASSGSQSVIDELDFAIIDYNLRWLFQEFPRHEPEVQVEILSRSHVLTRDIAPKVIERAPEPLRGWIELSRRGDDRGLREALQGEPTVENLPVGESPENTEAAALEVARQEKKRRRDFFIFTTKRRIRHVIIYLIFRPLVFLLPVDSKRAMFSNYWGNKFSLSDGPAALAIELSKRDPSYTIVVVVSQRAAKVLPKAARKLINRRAKTIFVKNQSFRYYYHLWRAKYLFNDVNFSIGFNVDRFVQKRPAQIEVQTTHGTPLKKMGIDSEVAINDEERPKFLAKTARYDYLVAPSPVVGEVFSKSHGVNPTILKTGLPQNDLLFQTPTAAELVAMKTKLGLDPHRKVIVYSPTYRHNYGSSFVYPFDVHALHEKFGADYQLVVKIHPFTRTHLSKIDFLELTDRAKRPAKYPFVRLFGYIHDDQPYRPYYLDDADAPTKTVREYVEADINELMLIADVLITDFSSIIFNYPHLKKPLILYAPDFGKYQADRGMYFDMQADSPGPFATTMPELIEALERSQNLDAWNHTYGDRIEAFRVKYHEWETGDASRKILEQVGLLPIETSEA